MSDWKPPEPDDPTGPPLPEDGATGLTEPDRDTLISSSGFRPTAGARMGRYRLRRKIGTGGMGIVFEADDTHLKRKVAIKFLRSTLADSLSSLERFTREAQAACQIDHPNAVSTYDVGAHDGLRFVVLELLEPHSAKDFIKREGAMHWTEATQVAAAACGALAAAHAAGVIHRDVKPDNFLRSARGVVKLTDFGLAKHATTDASLTNSGAVLGTPQYMSPEQCQGEEVDARSDIYSLGASYYALLTGHRPFHDAKKIADVLFAHCYQHVPDPGDEVADLPQLVRDIVMRAMEKVPGERYQDADSMLADLEAALADADDVPEPRFLAVEESLPGSSKRIRAAKPLGTSRSAASTKTPTSASIATVVTAPSATVVKPTRRRLLLGGGAAAVALAAVGGWFATRTAEPSASPLTTHATGTGAASAATIAGSETASPDAAVPIRVGVLHSLSGTMAISEKSVVDATLLAIDQVNAEGGVLGRSVTPVVADGRSDSATFASEAERLISAEQVPVIFGGWTSASRKTMKPVLEKHDHLLFYPVQYEGLEQSPNIVYTGAAPNQQILPALRWCSGYLGAKRFFLVGSDYVFPRTANAIMRDVLVADGKEVVGEEYLLLGSTDTAEVVDRIREAAPDVILNTINGDTNVAFFRTLRGAGVTPDESPVVSFSIGEGELRQITGVSLAGDYLAWNYFQSVDRPENEDFVTAFRERYGSYRVTTDPMEAAYFGVLLWARAAREAGNVSPVQVRRALGGMSLSAPGAKVTVDPENQHTWKVFRLGKIGEAGAIQMVYSTEAPIRPEPYPPSRTQAEWNAFLDDLYRGWGDRWANPGRE